MSIGAIIQARMGSSRLPGKVLKHLPFLSDETALRQVVKRVSHVKKIDKVLIATTTNTEDDPIARAAEQMGIQYFRGSEFNVLERYYLAAKQLEVDHIIRITSDCPVLDPAVLAGLIEMHSNKEADFSSIGLQRSFPIGQDAAIFSNKMLSEAHKNATQDYEREHVTTYFYKTHPDRYKIEVLKATEAYADPTLRLTLDTPEDYVLLCCLFDELYEDDPLFGMDAIRALLDRKPYLRAINSNVVQKKVAHGLEEQISAVLPLVKQQGYEALEKLLLSIKLE